MPDISREEFLKTHLRTTASSHGFCSVLGPVYPCDDTSMLAYVENRPDRKNIVDESRLMGDYPDSDTNPGSSYLRIGCGSEFLLDRDDVAALIQCLQYWLDHKKLPMYPEVPWKPFQLQLLSGRWQCRCPEEWNAAKASLRALDGHLMEYRACLWHGRLLFCNLPNMNDPDLIPQHMTLSEFAQQHHMSLT